MDSIKRLEGDNHVVIVDNASPDGTGQRLLKQYAGDPKVTVLLNREHSILKSRKYVIFSELLAVLLFAYFHKLRNCTIPARHYGD